MFKLLLMSILIAPAFIGIIAAKDRKGGGDRAVLRAGWLVYTAVWFGMLYVIKYRWT